MYLSVLLRVTTALVNWASPVLHTREAVSIVRRPCLKHTLSTRLRAHTPYKFFPHTPRRTPPGGGHTLLPTSQNPFHANPKFSSQETKSTASNNRTALHPAPAQTLKKEDLFQNSFYTKLNSNTQPPPPVTISVIIVRIVPTRY